MVLQGRKRAFLLAAALSAMAQLAIAHKAITDEDDAVSADSSMANDEIASGGEPSDTIDAELAAKKAAVDAAPAEPFDPVVFATTHVMESCFMAFFVVCFIVLFVGKRHNAAIAQLWHKTSLPLISDQFAYVGMHDGKLNTEIEQTSWSEFTFYASGRKNCFYSLYKLELDKRHCFFSRYVLGLLGAGQDVLTVDIPILFPGGDYGGPPPYPIEFFLTKKSRHKAAMDTHEHFKTLLYTVRATNLPMPEAPRSKKEARD